MDTTTPVDGVAPDDVVSTETTQPKQTEAVAEAKAETSDQDEAVSEAGSNAPETQAEDFDAEAYAKKKGIDLDKVSQKELVKMQYEAEKRMHEATSKSRELETQAIENVGYSGDTDDELRLSVNQLLVRDRVREFFDRNPDARDHEAKMAELVQERPHLQNDLDALHALAARESLSGKEAELKSQGGREALTNLAQKQQAIPPSANATNKSSYGAAKITPENVDDMVANMSQEEYLANREEILAASFPNRPR